MENRSYFCVTLDSAQCYMGSFQCFRSVHAKEHSCNPSFLLTLWHEALLLLLDLNFLSLFGAFIKPSPWGCQRVCRSLNCGRATRPGGWPTQAERGKVGKSLQGTDSISL